MSAFFHSGKFTFPRYIRTPFLMSFLLSCVYALTCLIYFTRIQPVVPLFYSLAQASEYLTSKNWLFIFPGFSVGLSIIHLWILRLIHAHDRLIILTFCWMTVILQALLGIAMLRIFWLVL